MQPLYVKLKSFITLSFHSSKETTLLPLIHLKSLQSNLKNFKKSSKGLKNRIIPDLMKYGKWMKKKPEKLLKK